MKKKEGNAYWLSMFGQNILYCIISTGLLYYFQNIIFIPVTFSKRLQPIIKIEVHLN